MVGVGGKAEAGSSRDGSFVAVDGEALSRGEREVRWEVA